MVLKLLIGQKVFLVEEPGISYAKGPVLETEVTKVVKVEGYEQIKVEFSNRLVLIRDDKETKWHTDTLHFRTFVILNNKPDLRHLRATHKFDDAYEAATFFAKAAAVGGGEAPKEMVHLLIKARVSNFDNLFQLAREANEKSRKQKHLLHRLIYNQSSFIFRHNGREVTAVIWRCLIPQCGYSAPPTEIAAEENGGKIVIKISGRPDGVFKRLKHNQEFKIVEF